MSIIITNISTHDDPVGLNQYVLRINRSQIVLFDHVRSDGLAKCLRRAADAAEKAERERMAVVAGELVKGDGW